MLCNLHRIGGGGSSFERKVEFCGTEWPISTSHIVCHDASVTDLTPVSQFPNLQHIDVSGSKVELEYLNVWNSKVQDLRPIATSHKLEHLKIGSILVSDLAPREQLGDKRLRFSDAQPRVVRKLDRPITPERYARAAGCDRRMLPEEE